ncbi:MAG: transglutaminase family protein, partial [Melioribacteraceae bacterium]|nr:transglutaminase family protein [Melioribacteraceae bacterium]
LLTKNQKRTELKLNQTKFKITHDTEYKFSSDVFFEPHYLRFRPKTTTFNELELFKIVLSPIPVGVSEQTDAENNLIHFCWFEGLNSNFKIHTESVVNIRDHNPLNFILYPSSSFNLPMKYDSPLIELLSQALKFDKISKPLIDYGSKLLDESEHNTVNFVTNVTRQIHNDFIVESRQEGIPFEADKTFSLKNGSCRDLVWMQIQLFRYMGIASRFVSGYYYVPLENLDFELHAWLEVYLPGAGWVGLDPSHGIVVGTSHIPIASSTHFTNTMTVTGTIRGDASADLASNILIEVL